MLQPLDLLCFSAVKLKYREQIADLASLNDAALIKKHRFIKYYHKAREEGLTARTIKSGWRTSGIYPWNPRKGLESSLLLQKVSRQLKRLTVEAVYKDAQIYGLQSQLKDLKGPKVRKRVAVDPNTKFANINLIKEAMEQAEEEEAKRRAKESNSKPQRRSGRKANVDISNSTHG